MSFFSNLFSPYLRTFDYFPDNIMPAGIYTYPFHFALPADLPSTFESSIAKVAYCIKIKSKPAYKLRKVVPFTVLGNVNLNHVDEILVRNYIFSLELVT